MSYLKNKKLLYGIATAILVVGVYFGYQYFQHYQNRFIQRAETSLNIGNREDAINAYELHVAENPSDFEIRLKLAGLYRETNNYGSSMRVYNRVLEEANYKEKDKKKYFRTLIELSKTVDDSSDYLNEQIENYLRAGNKQMAKKLADNFYTLNAESPFVSWNYVELSDTANSNDFAFYNSMAVSDYKMAAVKKAVVNFKAGYESEARSTISLAGFPMTIVTQEEINSDHMIVTYSSAVRSFAEKSFDNNNWDEAARAFEEAKYQAMQFSKDGSYTGLAAENHYNVAISYYNGADYYRTVSLLEELQEEAPSYEPEMVANLLDEARSYTQY